jgi:hypothetical protein
MSASAKTAEAPSSADPVTAYLVKYIQTAYTAFENQTKVEKEDQERRREELADEERRKKAFEVAKKQQAKRVAIKARRKERKANK